MSTQYQNPDTPYIPCFLDNRLAELGLTVAQRYVAEHVLRWAVYDTEAQEYTVHWPIKTAAKALHVDPKLITVTKRALEAANAIQLLRGANREEHLAETWVVSELIREKPPKKEKN